MSGPLDGVTVLDLSRVLTGPYCSMMLADMGAEVVKVERPDGGDDTRGWGPPWVGDESHYFLSVNRNKKSLTLNLKTEQGQKIAHQLVEKADVVLENFSPGTAERLGLDYDKVKELNSDIVYCSISGFGQDGPYRERPAYDLILQGMGGLMGVTGPEGEEPIRVGVAVADIGAGMYAAYAIAAALVERSESGQGQYIDVSMMDVQVSWMSYMAHYVFASGEIPVRRASGHPSIVPYQAFPTADGWINVTVGNDSLWQRFAPLVDIDPCDSKFATNSDRIEHRDELIELISNEMETRTTDEWMRILDEAKVPCGPVYDLKQVLSDPQVEHRDMIQKMQHTSEGEIDVLGIPVKLSRTEGQLRTAPPLLGEHNADILSDLGYKAQDIQELVNRGVITPPVQTEE